MYGPLELTRAELVENPCHLSPSPTLQVTCLLPVSVGLPTMAWLAATGFSSATRPCQRRRAAELKTRAVFWNGRGYGLAAAAGTHARIDTRGARRLTATYVRQPCFTSPRDIFPVTAAAGRIREARPEKRVDSQAACGLYMYMRRCRARHTRGTHGLTTSRVSAAA